MKCEHFRCVVDFDYGKVLAFSSPRNISIPHFISVFFQLRARLLLVIKVRVESNLKLRILPSSPSPPPSVTVVPRRDFLLRVGGLLKRVTEYNECSEERERKREEKRRKIDNFSENAPSASKI